MASNSKREQILEAVVTAIEAAPAIVTVNRLQPTYNDLSSMSGLQLPYVAVVGQMPRPIQKVSKRSSAQADRFRSSLGVDIVCYAMANDSPDTLISDLADDLWTILNADQSWGGLAIGTEVLPETIIGRWQPYFAFKLSCEIEYIHGLGGI